MEKVNDIKITEPKISTSTINGKFKDVRFDIKTLLYHLEIAHEVYDWIDQPDKLTYPCIKYIKQNDIIRGIFKKKRHNKNSKKKKEFFNSFTISVALTASNNINIKLFGSGSFTLTGCLCIEDGKAGIEVLRKKIYELQDRMKGRYYPCEIKNMNNKLIKIDSYYGYRGLIRDMQNKKTYQIHAYGELYDKIPFITAMKKNNIMRASEVYNYNMPMINNTQLIDHSWKMSNINAGCRTHLNGSQINKEKNRLKLYTLNDILVNDHFLLSTYDPDDYLAINCKYEWDYNKKEQDGVCYCKDKCSCKTMTIAIFDTGYISITGVNCKEQLDCAYNFISGVFDDNSKDIVKAIKPPPPLKKKEKYIKA